MALAFGRKTHAGELFNWMNKGKFRIAGIRCVRSRWQSITTNWDSIPLIGSEHTAHCLFDQLHESGCNIETKGRSKNSLLDPESHWKHTPTLNYVSLLVKHPVYVRGWSWDLTVENRNKNRDELLLAAFTNHIYSNLLKKIITIHIIVELLQINRCHSMRLLYANGTIYS